MTIAQASSERSEAETRLEVVDADVHPIWRSIEELREFTPEPWRTRDFGEFEPASKRVVQLYPSPHGHGARLDSLPPDGGPAASDPEFTAKQLFERAGVTYAILIPLGPRPQVNPEHDLANCMACNTWLAETWLSKENHRDIYRGSLRVPTADPELAVREIERWAGDARFVQVMLDPGHQTPLGWPQFHKVYEAAERHGLAVAFHPIKASGIRFLTPAGFPSYFLDQHAQLSHIVAAQLTSLVFEGVFDKFPDLRVAAVEGGFGWAAPLIWRLDRNWKALRSEVPWVRRPPSEYIREQVRFTTQPFEEAEKPAHLDATMSLVGSEKFFLFATDYPHWDADDPQWIFRHLPKQLRSGILRDNALEFYRLPARDQAAVDV
jgi:predicted TIM-barrel fold metal-dependent hydrolase